MKDLKYPRINILYIAERKQDAEMLNSKYTSFGAEITLFEVNDDQSTEKHASKLYYFYDTLRFKEIAKSLTRDLRYIEPVSSQFLYHLDEEEVVHFALWLVRKIPANRSTDINPKERQPKDVEQGTLDFDISSESLLEITGLVQCSKCKSLVRNDRLATHLSNIHKKRKHTVNYKKKISLTEQSKPKSQPTKSQLVEPRIILISKRGTRIHKRMPCDSCHSIELVLWQYSKSNKGVVNICGRCKSSVFNRSFKKVDAMNLAFQGGAFETNRRRH